MHSLSTPDKLHVAHGEKKKTRTGSCCAGRVCWAFASFPLRTHSRERKPCRDCRRRFVVG